MERTNTTKRINPKLGLKESQDKDISMERKNNQKNPKLGLKKSQDIKSKKYIYIYIYIYKTMSKKD